MSHEHDVLVVGAGPAGSSLAMRLADAGQSVALLDRKTFPRPKPCGEFLSPECLPILEDLGVRNRLLTLGARRLAGMRIHGYGSTTSGYYRDIGYRSTPFLDGYAIRREVFDHELVKLASSRSGVDLLEGWTCRGLSRDPGGRVVGARAADPTGNEVEMRARWTVGADGVRSVVARELGVQRRIPWLDKFALVSHYAGVPEKTTAEVHVFPGGYFAAAPVDGDRFSLNLVVDRARLAERSSDWDGFFADHLARAPELSERMAGARRVAPVRGCGPLAMRTTSQAVDGAVLVGDACGYVDPITGEGIYFALRGAELLARDLTRALAGGRTSRRAMFRYVWGRRLEIGPRLLMAKLLQRGLRHEGVARKVLALLERRPGLADLLVSITGDYVKPRELMRPSVWMRACMTGGAR